MLTNTDLKEIDKVVTKRVKNEVNPLKKDINTIKSDVYKVWNEVGLMKKDVKTIKFDVSQVRKDVKVISSFFDREYLELRKRVDRIEEHLGIATM